MNAENIIKIQAYLDGELTEGEAREVAELIGRDADARQIHQQLREVSALIKANEPEARMSESREFFWSKIEREINREQAPATIHSETWGARWLRILAPVAGAAFLLALTLVSVRHPALARKHLVQEIDSPMEEASAMMFHSQAAGMTVVWIQSQEN